MRTRACVLGSLMLLALPSWAAASQISFFGFLNSDLTFGTIPPDQAGRDLSTLSPLGPIVTSTGDVSGGFEANAGGLVSQTVTTDGSGNVVSTYRYGAGTFKMDLAWLLPGGAHGSGSFEAPIVSFVIEAGEGIEAPVSATYLLGPGLFDPALAAALGVGLHGLGGTVRSGLVLTDNGNRSGVGGTSTTPERQAWDGFADVNIPVPEPATTALLASGIGAAVLRRRTYARKG